MSKYWSPFLIGTFVLAAIAYVFCISQRKHITDFDKCVFNEETHLQGIVAKNRVDSVAKLDSLFHKWHEIVSAEGEQLVISTKNIENSLTLWLAVITAVCTVLPVVLAINQNRENEQLAEDMKKKLSEARKENEQQKDEFRKHTDALRNETVCQQRLQKFSAVSQTIRTLCDMQQQECRQNAHFDGKTMALLKMLSTSARKVANDVGRCDNIPEYDAREEMMQSVFVALCSMRNMLYQYENYFSDKDIIALYQLKDRLNIETEDVAGRINKGEAVTTAEIREQLSAVATTANNVYDIFCRQQEKQAG